MSCGNHLRQMVFVLPRNFVARARKLRFLCFLFRSLSLCCQVISEPYHLKLKALPGKTPADRKNQEITFSVLTILLMKALYNAGVLNFQAKIRPMMRYMFMLSLGYHTSRKWIICSQCSELNVAIHRLINLAVLAKWRRAQSRAICLIWGTEKNAFRAPSDLL